MLRVRSGGSPSEERKARRASRSYIVSKKSLSRDWSQRLQLFMDEQWPVLCSCHDLDPTRAALVPPAREGKKSLFPTWRRLFRRPEKVRNPSSGCSSTIVSRKWSRIFLPQNPSKYCLTVRFVLHDQLASIEVGCSVVV